MGKIRIAIIDDEELFLESLGNLLKDYGELEIVGLYKDGQSFLEEIEAAGDGNKPDLILLDLKMEPVSGIQLASRLNDIQPGVKVIVLSTHYQKSFVGYIFKLGVNAFLSKSISKIELLKAIKTVHQRGLYLTDDDNKGILEYLKTSEPVGSLFQPYQNLSEREIEVLKMICEQKTNKEIADELFISKRTVDGHRMNLIEKTGARNTAGLVVFAIHNRIIDMEELRLFQMMEY